jgi:hypothetical protein
LRSNFADAPATTEPASNDFVTTELAPTMQLVPNRTPGMMTALQPMKHRSPMCGAF